MTTKLTLTIEKKTVATAKRYAERKGKSLSNIVENYLKSISSKEEETLPLSPKVSRLMGAVKLPANFNYKKTLTAALEKKYKK